MLYIEKKPTPPEIQSDIDRIISRPKWRTYPEHPDSQQAQEIRKKFFNDLDKHKVRAALIEEQHGLCAYCMDRIHNQGSTTTIEHLVPLSKSKAGAMDFQNWLGVCKGGTNISLRTGQKRVTCCDAKKSNTVTQLTPLKREQMEKIAYYRDGTIYYNGFSDENYSQLVHDLNNVYGLNGVVDPKSGHCRKDTTTGIVKKRKDAYISLYDELERMHLQGALTVELLDLFRQDLLDEKKWEPFIGVKLYVLRLFEEFLTNP